MYQVAEGHCFHCGEVIPDNEHYSTELLQAKRHFCCPGCQEVAKAIVASDLQDYYLYRSEVADKANALPDELANQNSIYDVPELGDDYISVGKDAAEVQLTIEGLNCPACAWLIEKKLNSLPAIRQVGVDVSARRATIRWQSEQLKLSSLLNAITELGYKARPFQPDEHEVIYQKENKAFLKKIGLAGLMTMQVMMLAFGLYFGVFGNLDDGTKQFFHWISLILSTPVVFYSGSIFIVSALNGLSARTLNMDLPVTIAILTTWFSSAWTTYKGHGAVYFESITMFIFLLLIGRYFEHRGRQKAIMTGNNATKQLPTFARVIEPDGNVKDKPAKSVQPGDIIQIKTGDIIPVDCKLMDGKTEVDESILTGESTPVLKTAEARLFTGDNLSGGDKLFGGTLNLTAPVKARVSAALKDSTIHQISRAQELAFAQKPGFAILADRLASYFVSIVLLIAAITWLYWANTRPDDALWITVSVLVATCPCALGLATPTAFSAAMSKLNSLGLILKRTDILESLNSVSVFAFDKTGTLTMGHPVIESWKTYDANLKDDDILAIAAGIELHSEHPIAAAFSHESPVAVDSPKVYPGEGIEAIVDGIQYRIGNSAFCGSDQTGTKGVADVYLAKSIAGIVHQKRDFQESDAQKHKYQLLAEFHLKDQKRPGLNTLIDKINHHRVMILSGDREQRVKEFANDIGVKQYQAGLKPNDKQACIAELQTNNEMVLMAGDGVNDAPVLARADISMAVNGASDFAQNAADIIMLKDNLSALAELMLIAKKTKRVIKQNFAWALGYNLLVLPFAVAGLLPPWAAVIGMSLSSLAVTFNSMRLNKNQGLTQPGQT